MTLSTAQATKRRPLVATSVTAQPIDPLTALDFVQNAAAGAGILFVGVVRDHDRGRPVTALEYVAHPVAAAVLAEVTQQMLAEHPALIAVSAHHRTGVLQVGEVALAVAVATAHRAGGFTATQELVDRIKSRVPIWKKQVFDDGDHEWVDCP